MTKIMLSVFLILVLGSCSYLGSIAESVKTANDNIAGTLIVGMCGITVGAYYRLKNPLHKEAVRKLCGGANAIELGD